MRQTIAPIEKDESCLFKSFSFLIYGNEKKVFDIREQIINFLKK